MKISFSDRIKTSIFKSSIPSETLVANETVVAKKADDVNLLKKSGDLE